MHVQEGVWFKPSKCAALLQEVVTLRTDMVKDATVSILEMHSIPAAVSKDLTAALSGEQPANSSHSVDVAPAAVQG